MLKFGTSNIGKVFAGGSTVASVYSGNNLIWQNVVPEEMLVFTGIDANGNYELDEGYTGAVEYMLGDPYTYAKYTQITPTPTEASAYNGKYVYNENTGKWTRATYNSSDDTLTPDWIVVGTTPAYNASAVYSRTDDYDEAAKQTRLNNMFNYKYFDGMTGEIFYGTGRNSATAVLSPAIGNLVIPDTYKGKPVTKINTYAYHDYTSNQEQYGNIFSRGNRPTSITFGANITELLISAFDASTNGHGFASSAIIFNNGLQKLNNACLNGMFAAPLAITFPSSTNYFGAAILSGSRLQGTITFTGSFNSQCGQSGTSIIDNTTYAIINSTVTSISGYLTCKGGSNIVFMHSANAPITLSLSKAKSGITADIYTDNTTVQNYDWLGNANITPTFHPLSEYTGS